MAHKATIHGIGVGVGEAGAGAPAVLLEARGELVPIFVDPGQAQTIELGRQGMPVERPLTHDLFVEILQGLDGTLDSVRIDDLRKGTFYAKLDLTVEQDDNQEHIVCDARPSDGIALAVRVDCPITITDAVIDEAGLDPDQVGAGMAERGVGGPAGTGVDTGFGSDPTDVGGSKEHESIDRDEGVDIDIEESDDEDDNDASGSSE